MTLPTCIRCSRLIRETQACIPVFNGQSAQGPEGPPGWHHYLMCCHECGALGDDTHKGPEPHKHGRRCSQYVAPPPCRAPIEGLHIEGVSQLLVCTRPADHKEQLHRAAARFAGPTDITVTWPRTG